MRYNTTDQRVEIWDGALWVGAGQGAGQPGDEGGGGRGEDVAGGAARRGGPPVVADHAAYHGGVQRREGFLRGAVGPGEDSLRQRAGPRRGGPWGHREAAHGAGQGRAPRHRAQEERARGDQVGAGGG